MLIHNISGIDEKDIGIILHEVHPIILYILLIYTFFEYYQQKNQSKSLLSSHKHGVPSQLQN